MLLLLQACQKQASLVFIAVISKTPRKTLVWVCHSYTACGWSWLTLRLLGMGSGDRTYCAHLCKRTDSAIKPEIFGSASRVFSWSVKICNKWVILNMSLKCEFPLAHTTWEHTSENVLPPSSSASSIVCICSAWAVKQRFKCWIVKCWFLRMMLVVESASLWRITRKLATFYGARGLPFLSYLMWW